MLVIYHLQEIHHIEKSIEKHRLLSNIWLAIPFYNTFRNMHGFLRFQIII